MPFRPLLSLSLRALAPALSSLALIAPLPLRAQPAPSGDDAIAAALMTGAPTREGRHVRLWASDGALAPDAARALVETLDRAVPAIEALTGRPFDAAHYQSTKIDVLVSDAVRISHVYGGYQHNRFAKPYLYLSPRRVNASTAPMLHELTHLMLWDFGSHALREGLASYVEARLAAEGIGYNSGVFGPASAADSDKAAAAVLAGPLGAELAAAVGVAGATDPTLTDAADPERRSGFYLLTRSFVQHLAERLPAAKLVALYEARDSAAAYPAQTGRTLAQWQASWTQALGVTAVGGGPR